MKDGLVSNARLCKAAIEEGLDQFVLYKAFTGRKWKPKYVDDILKAEESLVGMRKLPTKTLADVVEALVGAAFVEGHFDMAIRCLTVFRYHRKQPFTWMKPDEARKVLFDIAEDDVPVPMPVSSTAESGEYSFRDESPRLAREAGGLHVSQEEHPSRGHDARLVQHGEPGNLFRQLVSSGSNSSATQSSSTSSSKRCITWTRRCRTRDAPAEDGHGQQRYSRIPHDGAHYRAAVGADHR